MLVSYSTHLAVAASFPINTINQGVVLNNGDIAYQEKVHFTSNTSRDAGNLFDASWRNWEDCVHGDGSLASGKFYIYGYKFENSGERNVSKMKFINSPSTTSTGIINIYYYSGSSWQPVQNQDRIGFTGRWYAYEEITINFDNVKALYWKIECKPHAQSTQPGYTGLGEWEI